MTTKLDCRVKDQFEIPGRDEEKNTISGKKASEVVNLREVRYDMIFLPNFFSNMMNVEIM